MNRFTDPDPRVVAAVEKIEEAIADMPRDDAITAIRSAQAMCAAEDKKKSELKRRIAACEELREDLRTWYLEPLTLERNECSRLHKLKEAMNEERVIDGSKGDDAVGHSQPVMDLEHTFVVKHDWARALGDAEGIDDSYNLPYEVCAFEFRIRGRTIIMGAGQIDGDFRYTSFLECGSYWWAPPEAFSADPLYIFLYAQIRAICIALDAEVATHAVVRAPHKLNEKRTRSGKPLLSDFHVVDLARRHRIANPVGGHGTGSRKRLHFRRGHWRHYETTKTWVRWCLVGNPDLGFINKEYSL